MQPMSESKIQLSWPCPQTYCSILVNTFLYIISFLPFLADVRQQKKPKMPEVKDSNSRESTSRENNYRDNKPGFFKSAPKYRSKSGSVSSLNSGESEASYKSYITPSEN